MPSIRQSQRLLRNQEREDYGQHQGLFVAMPSYKAGNGEYKDICFPVTKEFREQLNNAVIEAYNLALTQSQQQKAVDSPPFEQPEQDSGIKMAGM